MKKDIYNLSKEELRKAKRKKERIQAIAIFIACIIFALAIIGAIVFGVVKLIQKGKTVETVDVIEEPIESENSEPDIVSDNEIEDVVSDNAITPEPEAEETIEVDKDAILDGVIQTYIDNMTLEQKVAGLFFLSPEELTGSNEVTIGGSILNEALNNYPVGGLIFSETNMKDAAQFKEMLFNIKAFTTNEIFLAVEDTDGENSPFVTSGLTEGVITDQKTIGEAGEPTGAYTQGIAIGGMVNDFSCNTVIGPLADVVKEGSYLEDESFGSDPAKVKDYVRNAVRGVEDENINTCIQFFPGYGDVKTSPESSRPSSSRTLEDIMEQEVPIYQDAIDAGADFVMVSQIAYKPITIDVPACLSSKIVTDVLRDEMEYNGIIITDRMDTRSLIMHYKHADAAVMAIEAGCDMLYCTGDFKKAYNGILEAVQSGQIQETRINESLMRIYRVKYRNIVDYEAIAATNGMDIEETE